MLFRSPSLSEENIQINRQYELAVLLITNLDNNFRYFPGKECNSVDTPSPYTSYCVITATADTKQNFTIELLPPVPTAAINAQYDAAGYQNVIDGYAAGLYSPVQVSGWIETVRKEMMPFTPGLHFYYCNPSEPDPAKGGCEFPE